MRIGIENAILGFYRFFYMMMTPLDDFQAQAPLEKPSLRHPLWMTLLGLVLAAGAICITMLFSPQGFTDFMGFPDRNWSYVLVFGLLGLGIVLVALSVFLWMRYWRQWRAYKGQRAAEK